MKLRSLISEDVWIAGIAYWLASHNLLILTPQDSPCMTERGSHLKSMFAWAFRISLAIHYWQCCWSLLEQNGQINSWVARHCWEKQLLLSSGLQKKKKNRGFLVKLWRQSINTYDRILKHDTILFVYAIVDRQIVLIDLLCFILASTHKARTEFQLPHHYMIKSPQPRLLLYFSVQYGHLQSHWSLGPTIQLMHTHAHQIRPNKEKFSSFLIERHVGPIPAMLRSWSAYMLKWWERSFVDFQEWLVRPIIN